MPNPLDNMTIHAGAPPTNLTSALDGAWVKLDGYETAVAILLAERGSTTSTSTLSIQQAQDASGAGAKAFTPDHWYKLDSTGLSGLKVNPPQSTGATVAILSSNNNLAYCEVRADQLDVAGGYHWFRMRATAATGSSAKWTTILYAFFYPRYQVDPTKAIPVV